MILVDTTVWIDFLAGRPEAGVVALEERLGRDEDVCICGVILTEILQGIRSDSDYRKTKKRLEALVYLPMRQETHVRAADLFRLLRKRGVTIRSPVDCIIAAVAIEHNLPLLHNDRDFDQIARHSKLRILGPKEIGPETQDSLSGGD